MTAPAARILHVTDTHLFARPGERLRGVDTRASLAAVLAHALAAAPRLHAVLATGDLAQDESAGAYAAFRDLLGPCGVPVWCVPGNHDDPALMAGGLAQGSFRLGGTASAPGWHLVLLSSHRPGDHGGSIAPAELARLEAELAAHPREHVLVALHHLPFALGSRWLDEYGLRNAAALLDVLDRAPQVRCVVAGHVHQASERVRNGVRYLTTPSTCFQFLPGAEYFAVDTRPPGYRWLELLPDGDVRTEVAWIEPPR